MNSSRNPTRRKSILGRFGKDERGVAAIEFAMVALPFFFIVFAIIETALATTAGVLLNNAVNQAARQVMTGEVQKGDMDAAGFRERICGDISAMMSCSRLKLDMRTFPAGERIPEEIKIKKGSVDDGGFCFDPGSQESITVLRAYYEWPWTTGMLSKLAEGTNGNQILSSMAAFMNEPFGGVTNPNSNC
jgi:Flp pilus assembly protein TadG